MLAPFHPCLQALMSHMQIEQVNSKGEHLEMVCLDASRVNSKGEHLEMVCLDASRAHPWHRTLASLHDTTSRS